MSRQGFGPVVSLQPSVCVSAKEGVFKMHQEYITTGEAAIILAVSGPRVRQLCDDGRLEHINTPLGRLVRLDSVLRLAAERQRDPAVQRWERRKRRFSQ